MQVFDIILMCEIQMTIIIKCNAMTEYNVNIKW